MFCWQCGKENKDGTKFCTQCGTPLEAPEAVPVTPPEPEITPARATTATVAPAPAPVPAAASAPKKAKVKMPKEAKSSKTVLGAIRGFLKGCSDTLKANRKAITKVTAIVVGVIVLLGSIGSAITTPKFVAEQYYRAIIKRDWNGVYNMLEVEQTPFTTKEAFFRMANSSGVYANRMDIQKVTSESQGLEKNKAGSSQEPQTKTVNLIAYSNAGASERNISVQLIKVGNKFLLFDNYKVREDSIIAKKFTVRCPSNATVLVDGTELTDRYLTSTASSGEKVYELPAMFCTDYQFTVKTVQSSYTETVSVYNGGSYYVSASKLK